MATRASGGGGGGDSHVLREYLVALGFRVDEQQHRRFRNTLSGLDMTAGRLGTALLGIASAAAYMAHRFMRSMEALSYSARYADVTIAGMQGMELAGRNAGLAAGEMQQTLERAGHALRSTPGLKEILQGRFGIRTEGRKTNEVVLDLMKVLEGFYKQGPVGVKIAEDWAEMLGISKEALFRILDNLPQIIADTERYEALVKKLGIDQDHLTKSAQEYGRAWNDVSAHASLFAQVIGDLAANDMVAIARTTQDLLLFWTRIGVEAKKVGTAAGGTGFLNPGKGFTDLWKKDAEESAKTGKPGLFSWETSKSIYEGVFNSLIGDRWRKWRAERDAARYGTPGGKFLGGDAAGIAGDDLGVAGRDETARLTGPGIPGIAEQSRRQGVMSLLEQKYGLPRGLLRLLYERESSSGRNPKSYKENAAGALGPFQFREATGLDYDVTDRLDFDQSAHGAARMWADLLHQYGGNVRMATAAWNWGQGNMQKFGMGNTPKETREFQDFMERGLQVNTDIHMHGVSDPQRAGEVAAQKQAEVPGNIVRNMSPRMR